MQSMLHQLNRVLAAQPWLAGYTKRIIPAATTDLFFLQLSTAVAVTLLPLFHLTIKNWTNGWMGFLAVISLIGLAFSIRKWSDLFPDWRSVAVVVALALPLVAVVAALLIRGEWVWKYLDGPSRFLLAALAFLWLRRQKTNFLRVFQVICPLAIWFTLVIVLLFPEPTQLWGGRFATLVADTNTFGIHIVLLGFFSFMMLQLNSPKSWVIKILLASSVGAAAYLSIGSQTRTGWIALPFLCLVWIFSMRGKLRKMVITFGVVVAFLASVVVSYPAVRDRAASIYTELNDYVDGTNTDTSGGLRIGIWRIAIELFKHRPLQGYGDYAYFKDYLNLSSVQTVANEEATDTIRNGPHNEILANALRSGVFGLVSTVGLFFLPLAVFWRGQASTTGEAFVANCLGLTTVVAFFVFGITLEVFNLKFCASFYGFLIAVFAAQGMSNDTSSETFS